jgi:hypothetical protein
LDIEARGLEVGGSVEVDTRGQIGQRLVWLVACHIQNMYSVIQNMYSGDTYHLVDGLTSTALISPSKGVKQGCPLSPILFELFLSDVGAALGTCHSTGRMGVSLQ